MDIYNFINSKDIAEYLKSINYNFSIIEASYIVYQCHNTTLKQKIEAWQEIIKTYPDCPYKRKRIDIESMHQFLRSYIFLKQRGLENFYRNNGEAVYLYWWESSEDDMVNASTDFDAVFSNYENCYEHFLKQIEDNYLGVDTLENITFRKVWLDPSNNYGKYISLELNGKYEVMSIFESDMSDDEEEIDFLFERMWFNIPTPFKRGDIVCMNHCDSINYQGGPFVLDCIANWDENQLLENGFKNSDYVVKYAQEKLRSCMKEGCTMDMWVSGYGIRDDNEIFEVKILETYLDIEYYRGEFKEAEIIREKMRAKE